MVLQGPDKGRVVNVDIERQPPKFSFESNFLDWYERWLDETISGLLLKKGPTWFGYTMGGDDRQLLEVFNATGDKDKKLAALNGFGKLISISAESADEMARIAASDDPELRRIATDILTEFAYPLARRPLEDLLAGSDEDQITACQTIHWYAKGRADEWVERVGPIAAQTNNSELFRFAAYVLRASSLDVTSFLLPGASNPDEAIRQQAIYEIGKCVRNAHTIDAILNSLRDESPQVVHAALQAHEKPFDDRFLEAYASIAARYQVDEHYVLTNLEHRLKTIGYKNVRAFVLDFGKKKARRQANVGMQDIALHTKPEKGRRRSFWSRIFGRKS